MSMSYVVHRLPFGVSGLGPALGLHNVSCDDGMYVSVGAIIGKVRQYGCDRWER